MTEIFELSGFSLALPVAVLFGSVMVSRLLKLPLIGTLIGASAPLALPFIDLPLAKDFTASHPEYIMGGAWMALLSIAIGWVVVRPLVSSAIASVGILRFAYFLLLGAALAVATLLMVNPEILSRYAPGWRGTAGWMLLVASILGMSLSLARVLRAALLLAVWSFVSLVLASELFLQKLPQDIVREDLRRLESVIPEDLVDSAIETLDLRTAIESSGMKGLVIGGERTTRFPFSGEKTLSGRLKSLFERNGVKISMRDASLPGASIFDVSRVLRETAEPLRPDIVFIAGWHGDKQRGVWSHTSQQALNEAEPGVLGDLLARARGSMLYRYVMAEGDASERSVRKPRVEPGDYQEELSKIVRSLRQSGIAVVLVSEPRMTEEDLPYREAMVTVAMSERALFVSSEKVMKQSDDPLVFARGDLLSARGYEVLAKRVVELVRSTRTLDSAQTT